jgi:hypothetical protein
LSLPTNVRILTLPPHSPELNPAEQLWDLIRQRRFANKAYDTLDDVEDELADQLRTSSETTPQFDLPPTIRGGRHGFVMSSTSGMTILARAAHIPATPRGTLRGVRT